MTHLPDKQWMDALATDIEQQLFNLGFVAPAGHLRNLIEHHAPAVASPTPSPSAPVQPTPHTGKSGITWEGKIVEDALKDDEQLIRERDEAEDAADKMASLILGEPIDWSDHQAKWAEAIESFAPSAAQQDKGWAERAAREIRKLADKEAGNGMMPDRSDMATIIAKAFAGFVPREEMERWKDEARLQKMACEAVEGAHRELSETLNLVGSQIEAGADDCIRECARTDAAQAQNAHLQADNAKLREKAEAVCIAWDAQDSTAKMELVCDDAVHALFNLLASPSTRPPKSEAQERGAPFDEEGTKGKA